MVRLEVSGDQVEVAAVVVAPAGCWPAVRARHGHAAPPVGNRVLERLQPLEQPPLPGSQAPGPLPCCRIFRCFLILRSGAFGNEHSFGDGVGHGSSFPAVTGMRVARARPDFRQSGNLCTPQQDALGRLKMDRPGLRHSRGTETGAPHAAAGLAGEAQVAVAGRWTADQDVASCSRSARAPA
jgi:hypothetical protein